MKNGKRPNKAQKISMVAAGLNASEWLVVKNLDSELHIVNRNSNDLKILQK